VKANYNLSDKWEIFVDIQERYVQYKTTDFLEDDIDTKWLFLNPKLGVTYSINDTNNFYLSYARGNKEPIRDDFENATKTPEAEKLDDIELGWRLTSDKIKLQTNVYYMQYKNQLVLTGELTDVGDFIRENSGESYRLGLEVDANISVLEKMFWNPNFSLSKNQNIDFYDAETATFRNTTISYSPDFIAGSNLVYMPVKNLQFALLSKYVSSQYMNNVDLEASKLDDYFTTDFHLQWKKENVLGLKQITITGILNNIFNEKYASNGYMWGTTPFYFPQAGTNFLVGLNVTF
jgi:iron complex outermembrane receptor protein